MTVASPIKGMCCICWPFNSNIDFSSAVVQGVEPALHEKSPLKAKSSDQEVESHTTKTVALQKGHEEAKTNKDHDMHILETWREDTNKMILMSRPVTKFLFNSNNKTFLNDPRFLLYAFVFEVEVLVVN